MKVKNINNTDIELCECGSWLTHWRNFSRQPLPTICPETRCLTKPSVGTLIQIDNATDDKWYIVPLCKAHNAKKGESLTISDLVHLVPAEVSETCGDRLNIPTLEFG
jgi:hypothetical protein